MYQKDYNQKNHGSGSKISLLVILAAVAAGFYFFAGEGGAENRRKARNAFHKIKHKTAFQMKQLGKRISKSDYYDAIEDTFEKYKNKAEITGDELKGLKYELQKRWARIQTEDELREKERKEREEE
ncbi:MAG TPA: hypothetical protein VFM02_00260 [Candidatus Paceibacterota bacterium]|nr:hypothetical protein [Candidatus Paceibacterota bacterium]